jgi:predicted phage terminase large subunit-like protein
MDKEQQVLEALQSRSSRKQKQAMEKALTEEILETKVRNRTHQDYVTTRQKGLRKGLKKVKKKVNSRPDVDTISMGYDRFLETLPGDTWKYLPHTFASVMSDGLWKPYPYLVMISNIMATVIARGGGRVLISVPPRHGKLIADDTLILTPDGPRRHGDLRAGDYVFGRDGKPVMVLGVSEKDIADCLVTFSDGQEILAHENHEWIVRDRSCHKEKILETKFFLNNNLSCEGRRGARGHRNRFQVDVNTTLEFPEKQLPLHPYFLGVWLGDGRSSSPDFCGDSKDIAIVTKLESLGYKTSSRWVHETTGVCYYYYRNGVKRILHELNVFNNKHIPDVYLYSSRQQRLDLLAGLVDTDGHRDPRGRYRISTCNEKITHQIKALVNSLGGHAYIMNAQPILSSSDIQGKQVVYQIGFNLPHILPVALERKSNKDIPYVHRCRAITAVRKVSGKPGHCIQVENGVYLVGETLIPTHNSFFISQWLPVWFLANWPNKRVLLSTYEANFAATWGRRARNIVKEKGDRVGLYLAEDSTASNNWATTAEGGMVTAGVGGPITGKGADLLIIDDPHKNWQEANSETTLKMIHEWFDSTFYTRQEPSATIVILHTRWNENDLIGYLLREKITDGWFSIRIPAIAEDWNGEEDVLGRAAGEALCPQRYDSAALNRIRCNMTPMMWNALFQQRPAPMEGSIFIRSKWKYYTVRPKCNFILQSWDTASKKNWDSAYSVCQTWGVGEDGAVLLEQWRDKVEYPQLRRQVEIQYAKHRPHVILIEDRDSGQALCQALQQETILPVLPVMPTMDKVIRAQAVSPMQESGRCWLPDPTRQENSWVGEFVDNAATFPNAFFKDEIDSMSQALAYIMTMAMSGRILSTERRRTSKLIEGFRDMM